MIRGVRSGKIYKVQNKHEHKDTSKHYNMIVIECNDGSIDELLFTDSELLRSISRSNKKSIPKYSLAKDKHNCLPILLLISFISGALGFFVRDLNLFDLIL